MQRIPWTSYVEASLQGIWGILAMELTFRGKLQNRIFPDFQNFQVERLCDHSTLLQTSVCGGEEQSHPIRCLHWSGLTCVGEGRGREAGSVTERGKNSGWALITQGLRFSWRNNECLQCSAGSSRTIQEQNKLDVIRLINNNSPPGEKWRENWKGKWRKCWNVKKRNSAFKIPHL